MRRNSGENRTIMSLTFSASRRWWPSLIAMSCCMAAMRPSRACSRPAIRAKAVPSENSSAAAPRPISARADRSPDPTSAAAWTSASMGRSTVRLAISQAVTKANAVAARAIPIENQNR